MALEGAQQTTVRRVPQLDCIVPTARRDAGTVRRERNREYVAMPLQGAQQTATRDVPELGRRPLSPPLRGERFKCTRTSTPLWKRFRGCWPAPANHPGPPPCLSPQRGGERGR